MSLEAAIMGFLAEKPRSGYDLKTRCFDEQIGAFWTADQAQIYRTLERLRTCRLVECTRRRQAGKPDRKVYRLTDSGMQSLAAWRASALALPAERDPFLLQVFFSEALADHEILSNLHARRQAHQSRLEQLRRDVANQVAQAHSPQRASALKVAAFDGAIARECASIDWLDDTIDAIERELLPATESLAEPPASGTPEAGSA